MDRIIFFFIHIINHRKLEYLKRQCKFHLVKPDPVSIEAFLTSNTVACSRRVQWQLLDTGNCMVEYNIEFKNKCDTIVGTVTGIRNNVSFYCTDDYTKSSSVAMWAVHNGVSGTKSKTLPLLSTQKRTITDTEGRHIAFSSFLFCFFHFYETKRQDFTLYYKI